MLDNKAVTVVCSVINSAKGRGTIRIPGFFFLTGTDNSWEKEAEAAYASSLLDLLGVTGCLPGDLGTLQEGCLEERLSAFWKHLNLRGE